MVQVGPGDQDCEPAQGQGRCRPHRGHHRRDPGRGEAEPANIEIFILYRESVLNILCTYYE